MVGSNLVPLHEQTKTRNSINYRFRSKKVFKPVTVTIKTHMPPGILPEGMC